MAKKAASKKVPQREPQSISITYELLDLPTPFHKAGLAGLVMLIRSLIDREKISSAEIQLEVNATSAQVTLNESLLQVVMDDLYDARIVEAVVRSKWQGATLKEERYLEVAVNGKTKSVKHFVYDVVQPVGQFLMDHFPDGDGLWQKLWRDMIWNIPRSRPTTRIPYNTRADDKPCGEGKTTWQSLLKREKLLAKNEFLTAEVSSALLLGAQAVNAENVPFVGRVEQNLLLHFWPLAVLIFVPQSIEADGSTDFVGYSLAVPEVSDLEEFVSTFPTLLSQLNDGLSANRIARGYRPARAVIDLAAESALGFMNQLAVLIHSKTKQKGSLQRTVRSVEFFHLNKAGNNVKTMSSGRIAARDDLIDAYRAIVTPSSTDPEYRNSLFRRCLLIALLDESIDESHWYRPFASVFQQFDSSILLRQPRNLKDEEETRFPKFHADASRKLSHIQQLHLQMLERIRNMPELDKPKTPPAVVINRVVRNYLNSRAETKSGIGLDKFRGEKKEVLWESIPANVLEEFNAAKLKVAESLFLEFRSRKEQAFVDHFAATFFSVTQRMNEEDRLELADMLVSGERREDLKILTLLALSANS